MGKRLKKILFYGLIGAILTYVLGPILWMFLASFLIEREFFQFSADLVMPTTLQLDYYKTLLFPWIPAKMEFGISAEYGWFLLKALKNTAIIALGVAAPAVILGSLASYAFARLRFPARQLLFKFYIVIQMIPGLAVLIPIFIIIRRLGLVDTYFGYIIPLVAFFLPFIVWMMIGFMQAIPVHIEEAALVDGCTKFSVIYRIMLPLAVPGLVATTVWAFLSSWGELMFALVLTGNKIQPISVVISLSVGEVHARYAFLSAQAVLALIPPIVLAIIFQRYLVRGLTAGAVKG